VQQKVRAASRGKYDCEGFNMDWKTLTRSLGFRLVSQTLQAKNKHPCAKSNYAVDKNTPNRNSQILQYIKGTVRGRKMRDEHGQCPAAQTRANEC
jgi:hypothetical protein